MDLDLTPREKLLGALMRAHSLAEALDPDDDDIRQVIQAGLVELTDPLFDLVEMVLAAEDLANHE